ncbi:unnamed protein product [Pieris brassicae]|uniref:Uncharacterized protein n=1 Tax=Pieris brassicae TaxID=7116 RepID=A0A9P0WX55_PIEBR|nr:unnamed protein product [Pieris brassicae]
MAADALPSLGRCRSRQTPVKARGAGTQAQRGKSNEATRSAGGETLTPQAAHSPLPRLAPGASPHELLLRTNLHSNF